MEIEEHLFYTSEISLVGALEDSSKWMDKTKDYSTGSKKWVGKYPFSMKVKQRGGWARANPAHLAPTPLASVKKSSVWWTTEAKRKKP